MPTLGGAAPRGDMAVVPGIDALDRSLGRLFVIVGMGRREGTRVAPTKILPR